MWLKWKFAWSHDVNELKWLHHPIYCTATHWLRFLLSFPARLQHSSPLCGSWRLEPTVKPQTWRRDSSPSSMPSLPHCLPPDGPPLKFSVRAATVKAERRLNTAGVSGCGSGKKKKRQGDGASWKTAPERRREQRRSSDGGKKKGDRMCRCRVEVDAAEMRRGVCVKRWEAGRWWKETMLVNKAEQVSGWWWMSDGEKTGPLYERR